MKGEMKKEPGKSSMAKALSKLPEDYTSLLVEVKERIRSAQYAALRVVNMTSRQQGSAG